MTLAPDSRSRLLASTGHTMTPKRPPDHWSNRRTWSVLVACLERGTSSQLPRLPHAATDGRRGEPQKLETAPPPKTCRSGTAYVRITSAVRRSDEGGKAHT